MQKIRIKKDRLIIYINYIYIYIYIYILTYIYINIYIYIYNDKAIVELATDLWLIGSHVISHQ